MNMTRPSSAPRRPHARPTGRPAQRGVTLLEVLVSVLIFSFGILGLVALDARSTQFSVNAEDRTRASLLANELASRMWTQGTVDLPAADVADWQARVEDPAAEGLANGVGAVVVNGNTAEITITWRAPFNPEAGGGNRYTTQVVMP